MNRMLMSRLEQELKLYARMILKAKWCLKVERKWNLEKQLIESLRMTESYMIMKQNYYPNLNIMIMKLI